MVAKAKVSRATLYVGNVDAPTLRPKPVSGSDCNPVLQQVHRLSPAQGWSGTYSHTDRDVISCHETITIGGVLKRCMVQWCGAKHVET
jgi:hypothetical protein